MNRSLVPVMIACFAWACGSSEFVAQDAGGGTASNSAGGKSSAGGRSSRGGNVSTTNRAAQCNDLLKEYMSALEAARVCDLTAGEPACKTDWVLPGTCQCNVPVVRETTAYTNAQTKLDAFKNAGCELALCDMACPGDSSGSEVKPICVAGVSGVPEGAAVCQWP